LLTREEFHAERELSSHRSVTDFIPGTTREFVGGVLAEVRM
jgi:hypothetical protein